MAKGPSATEARHLRMLFAVGAIGGLSDGHLLERFATLGGDAAELAFTALVERHGPMVLRVAQSVLRDGHRADDAFQATFLLLARKARSLWVRDSLGPWLHAVAFRVASQGRSSEVRRKRHERTASRPEAIESREGDRTDLVGAIHEEIGRLPQPYRLAVVTCHLEGLTQHEAARRLGWPVGTLQSRLARGRRRLRDRLERRGLAPSLMVLAEKLAPVPPALMASTAKVASALNLGGATAGMIAPAVLAMIEITTKGMLMTKLKFGAVALVMACGLVGSGMGLGVGRNAKATDGPSPPSGIDPTRPQPVETSRFSTPTIDAEPRANPPHDSDMGKPTPKPWATAARIKIHRSDTEWGICSGTVIRSTPEESLILTCARNFKDPKSFARATKDFKFPVTVDLFGDQLAGLKPAMVPCIQRDVVAEVVDLDEIRELGLLRIKPGRVLPASPVVPVGWKHRPEMKMIAVGCSRGNDATAWDTTFLFPANKQTYFPDKVAGGRSVPALKCAHRPREGRSGGGLFTPDGYLAGVNFQAVPVEEAGLYVPPESIRAFLDRNKLSRTFEREDDEPGLLLEGTETASRPEKATILEPIPHPAVSDQDRRLDDLERKLDRVLKALEDLTREKPSAPPRGSFPLQMR